MSQSRYLPGSVHVVPTARYILGLVAGIIFLVLCLGCKIQKIPTRKDTGKNIRITVRQTALSSTAVRQNGCINMAHPRPPEISGQGGWLQAGIALSKPRPELIQSLPWTLNYLYIAPPTCLTLPNAEVSYAR